MCSLSWPMPTYDTYLPITLPFKDKSSDGLPAEVLPGVYICILYSNSLNKKEQQQQRE